MHPYAEVATATPAREQFLVTVLRPHLAGKTEPGIQITPTESGCVVVTGNIVFDITDRGRIPRIKVG